MAVVSQVVTPEVVTKRQPTGALIRRALQLRRTQIGLGLVLVILAIAIIGPHIAPHGGNDFVGAPNSLKVPGALFGTDHIGQDVWSRFLHGGLTILVLAAAATLLGLVLGIAVGLVAAYSRNVLDDILMRAMDVILAFPQIMLALVAIATVGPNPLTIILAVGLTTMPRVARVTRGASQPVVERDFVAAAEAIGVPRVRILLSEIFPNRVRAINGMRRISKPGLRVYARKDQVPRVLGGLGIAVLSSSKGIMSDKQARKQGVGGEVLCYVW